MLIGRLSGLPFTIFERLNVFGHQRFERDQPEHYDLVRVRQRLAHNLVRKQHCIGVARIGYSNVTLDAALTKRSTYKVGSCLWVYSPVATSK